MSRGIGKFQEEVLAQLGDAPILRNKLQWELAGLAGRVSADGEFCAGIPRGRIDPNFEKQFGAAIRGLVERQVLLLQPRAAANFEEFVSAHPYQTTALEIQRLRLELLPHLPHNSPRFGIAANELHLIARVRHDDRPRFRSLVVSWRELELVLRRALGANASHDSLFLLLVRGRELFGSKTPVVGSRVTCSSAFTVLVERVCNDNQIALSDSTRDGLRSFAATALPPDELGRLANNSRLIELGHFGGSGSSSLDDVTKAHLLKEAPDLIARLPGFHPAHASGNAWHKTEVTFPPILDRLIERTAFGPLPFVVRASHV